MLLTRLAVLGRVIYRTVYQELPTFEIMGIIGIVALMANVICLALLSKYRTNDINMTSVWVCSRNDIIANISVLVGTGLVFMTRAPWPDLVIGLGLTLLFTMSAYKVFKEAAQELKHR